MTFTDPLGRNTAMRRWIWTTVALLVLVLPDGRGLANMPFTYKSAPGQTPTIPVVVVVDDKATETRLVIPRKVLAAALRADAGEPGDTQRAEGLPALHLIVAGVALTVALALGGLWLVRLRSRPAPGPPSAPRRSRPLTWRAASRSMTR